jgi:acetylornithine deacetylase/succinyl-diaminopimelate desuccinylase-like protein
MPLDAALAKADANLPASLERLFAILRIPSISTDPAFHPDCRRAAEWAAGELKSLGFDARLAKTAGQPMVVAHLHPPSATRHVLFYGHYDVQPADPLDLWGTPPFEPVQRNGQIVARGASDDKGQFMTFIEAVRAVIDTTGSLPVAVTVLLEGEEESGSPSLKPFLDAHKQELKADVALVCDTGQWSAERPAITTRLRGLMMDEITITAPNRDLHSGMFGGPALNPVRALAKVLAALHDDDGRVAIPGFYEGVAEPSPDVLAQWQALGFDEAAFLRELGLTRLAGETGRNALEQIWARPTCDVNGIWGGYTGEGSKTVIPSKASAKVSFRLVAGQDPLAIREAFRSFIKANLLPDAKVDFHAHGASPALELPLSSPYLTAARGALADEWGIEPVLMGCGGSIPIVGSFQRDLGMDTLLIGFALDDDRIHSPNEKYELASFHKGIRSWVRVLDALGRMA